MSRSLAILSSANAGGAGIASRRMVNALRTHSSMEVDFINSQELGEMLPPDVARQTSYSNHTISDTHFSFENPGFARGWLIEMLRGYDAINIHWAAFLLSLAELDALSRSGIPMIFTSHDFHYITGGCHYPASCTNFHAGCFSCPQVDQSRIPQRHIARNHSIKREIFSRPNVHFSAPSAYLRDRAVASGIVPKERAHLIRNPYQPLQDVTTGRQRDEIRILLIADTMHEGRKQMRLALDTLQTLSQKHQAYSPDTKLQIDLVGKMNEELRTYLAAAKIPYKAHGRITDHGKLSRLYATCEFMLTCSNEDNWPNILVEAGSYGCVPIVGPGHGCEEFVRLYNFGQVAKDYTAEGFMQALTKAIERWSNEDGTRAAALIRADHTPQICANGMINLIDQISATAETPAPQSNTMAALS